MLPWPRVACTSGRERAAVDGVRAGARGAASAARSPGSMPALAAARFTIACTARSVSGPPLLRLRGKTGYAKTMIVAAADLLGLQGHRQGADRPLAT